MKADSTAIQPGGLEVDPAIASSGDSGRITAASSVALAVSNMCFGVLLFSYVAIPLLSLLPLSCTNSNSSVLCSESVPRAFFIFLVLVAATAYIALLISNGERQSQDGLSESKLLVWSLRIAATLAIVVQLGYVLLVTS